MHTKNAHCTWYPRTTIASLRPSIERSEVSLDHKNKAGFGVFDYRKESDFSYGFSESPTFGNQMVPSEGSTGSESWTRVLGESNYETLFVIPFTDKSTFCSDRSPKGPRDRSGGGNLPGRKQDQNSTILYYSSYWRPGRGARQGAISQPKFYQFQQVLLLNWKFAQIGSNERNEAKPKLER
ncbi:ribosome maturation factor RimP [Striga asiatica]|uniref:Ribosome maturation factor RimP n=1 Tax=Striga asiatica TaxID=4170 RepID=A0A5A7QHJ5_STRAF|nr:ribosome maturation factor RimP [Striga asiatica]